MKVDLYKRRESFLNWKERVQEEGIPGLFEANSATETFLNCCPYLGTMEMERNFSVNLKNALIDSARSMRSIANEAHVSNESVGRFVHGKNDLTLRVATALADVVMPDYGNVQFISGKNKTEDYLTYMAQSVQDGLKIIGSEIFALGELENAVDQGINYTKILTGDYVSDPLTNHLQRVASSPKVEIYQTPVQQYSQLMIADNETIFLLSNADGVFGGFHVNGPQEEFSRYFQHVIHENRTQNTTSKYQKP